MTADCPTCGVKLPKKKGAGCKECDWKPDPDTMTEESGEREVSARKCLADGAVLETAGKDAGRCSATGQYPVVYRVKVATGKSAPVERLREFRCPLVCPYCTGPLTWDGGCDTCHGSSTPRDDTTWTFQGDRYGMTEDRHWAVEAPGPRPVASPADVAAAMREVRRALANAARRGVPTPTRAELRAEEIRAFGPKAPKAPVPAGV